MQQGELQSVALQQLVQLKLVIVVTLINNESVPLQVLHTRLENALEQSSPVAAAASIMFVAGWTSPSISSMT